MTQHPQDVRYRNSLGILLPSPLSSTGSCNHVPLSPPPYYRKTAQKDRELLDTYLASFPHSVRLLTTNLPL
ncbi:MAG: hypothetical protein Q3M30_07990 [Candidatus Electrothrix sp. Rat3]|nr:hypothetical protein [Candidatus Electrothrix rattekaaiensis]